MNCYESIPIRLFSEASNDNKSDSNGREEKKKKRAKVVLEYIYNEIDAI